MLILLIDDDTQYAEMSAETLRRDSHEVIIAHSTRAAERVLGTGGPECTVLDMMSDGGGVIFAQTLRSQCSDLPIIFVSRAPSDRVLVAAYDAGADDFITKPFNPRELILRVRAVTRRCMRSGGDSSEMRGEHRRAAIEEHAFGASGLTFVGDAVQLNGQELNCTPLEADILRELTWVPGQVLSYDQLNERVWGYSDGPGGTLLKGHVSSLRRKLEDAGGRACMIRTVRGVGYAFSPE